MVKKPPVVEPPHWRANRGRWQRMAAIAKKTPGEWVLLGDRFDRGDARNGQDRLHRLGYDARTRPAPNGMTYRLFARWPAED